MILIMNRCYQRFRLPSSLRNTRFILCTMLLWAGSFIPNHCTAQTVYVPTHHWVYDFLERLETKGILSRVHNNTRPMTRIELAEYLAQVVPLADRCSRADRQQLDFLRTEFREELEKLHVPAPEEPTTMERLVRHKWVDRWLPNLFYANGRNFLSLDLPPAKVYLDPILVRRREYAKADTLRSQERVFTNTNGWVLWGTLGQYVGFLTDARDNQEWGTRNYLGIDNFTLEGRGFVRSNSRQIDFDETRSHLAFHWKYLTLQYGKDKNRWGPGYRGQLAISDHPTSYDQIKLQIDGHHFRFTSLWALLQHYQPGFFKGAHAEKYLAAHRLEFSPWRFIDIGLHEMVIYAGRKFEPSYLNPLMFWRSAEHYLGDRDNAAMGLDLELKFLPKTKLYGELFIDDITTGRLSSDFYANKYAYLAGMYHVDLLGLDNLDFRLEYARVRPFTYTHGGVTNFQQYSTNMGHRLGPNADEWFCGLKYQYSRAFYVESYVAVERHGGNTEKQNFGGSLFDAWEYDDGEYFRFLGGVKRRTTTFMVLGSYEFLRNAFLQVQYSHADARSRWSGNESKYPGHRSAFMVRLAFNE